MDLGELIRISKGDRSYEQLARAGGLESGTPLLGAARWQQLATQQLNAFPAPRTMTAIATALGVSEETVLLATGTSLGLQLRRRNRLLELMPDKAAELPDQCITSVLTTIRVMCDLREGPR